VDVLPCGHVAREGEQRLCRHLLGEEPLEISVCWLLRGVGLQYDLCCAACAQTGQRPELVEVCEECAARAGQCMAEGIVGEPEIRHRPEPVRGELSRTALPVVPVDVAPLDGCPGQWLVLGAGELLRWHAASGEIIGRWPVELPGTDPDGTRPPRYRLHASPGGEFAVIAADYRQHGVVLELGHGRVTMKLDRGIYHVEQTPFPVAFLQIDGELLLVHATSWNRVDLSDPGTGAMLTPRQFENPGAGQLPEHEQDYFYGALYPSPDGQLIASDGWVWAPVGVTWVWDARRWRHGYAYEPEDGGSAHAVRAVNYYWDEPVCWLDERRIALSGIDTDDQLMIPGVEIYNVETEALVTKFAGPAGQLYCDGDRLYSASPAGLRIWDIGTGECTGTVPGFTPARYHHGSAELAAIDGGDLVRWPAG
jgi:hypothetical protein